MASLASRTAAFARDVAGYAGVRGVRASVFVAAGAVLEGVGVVLLPPLLAILFSESTADLPGGRWVGPIAASLGQDRALQAVLAGFGLIMVLRALVLWQRDGLLGALQIGYVESRRREIARRLAAARWETLSRLGHARVTHVMGADIQRCGAGVQFLLQGGVALVVLTIQIALALALAPLAALVALAVLAAGAAALAGLFRSARSAGAQVTGANLSLMVGLGRFLGGLKAAMSQNLQGPFIDGFERDLAAATAFQTAFIRQQSLMRVLWSLIGVVAAGATLVVGLTVLQSPPAVLIALLVILARIGAPASQLQLGVQQIAFSLTAWETLNALRVELTETAPQRSAATAPPTGAIVFDRVGYRHPDGGGFDRLDLRIDPGEFVGISGPSGSGKTTLADLLSGLIRPDAGEIRVGGRVLDEAAAVGWRDRTAYVSQDAFLFNDTIRNNLLWGGVAADEAAVADALSRVGADRMVGDLPQGLDTIVGELGSRVSGGERQRLALARALLRRPDLLILDEATNALDLEAERAILAGLAALRPRPAIVLIAHRQESFAACDRVVRFPLDAEATTG